MVPGQGLKGLVLFAALCFVSFVLSKMSFFMSSFFLPGGVKWEASLDAGCFLSLGVLLRFAAAAINYEIFCMLDDPCGSG